MRTYDIIVVIHRTRKMGDKTKSGPDCLDQFGAATDVSGPSTRPEGPTLAGRLPNGWGVDYAVKDRKAVKIGLPDGMEPGEYKIENVAPDGLHSTAHKVNDGMGSTIYCRIREIRLSDPGEDYSTAIDQVIHFGIILLMPGANGKRHEVEARALAVSDLYRDRVLDNWTWSR